MFPSLLLTCLRVRYLWRCPVKNKSYLHLFSVIQYATTEIILTNPTETTGVIVFILKPIRSSVFIYFIFVLFEFEYYMVHHLYEWQKTKSPSDKDFFLLALYI